MSAFRFSKSGFGLTFVTLLAVSLWPAASRAYTPEQQQACTDDAMRLCGAYVPDVDRITACMVQNRSQLSPGCRVYFRPEPAVAAGTPLMIRPVAPRKPVGAKPAKRKKPAQPAPT